MTKKKSDDILEEPCKRFLKYNFTEAEIKDLGSKLAKAFSDHTEAESRLKSVSTQIKSEITATITCLDTGEVIEERPMDAEERQRKLELQPKE